MATYLKDKIKPADLGGGSGPGQCASSRSAKLSLTFRHTPDIDNKTLKHLIDKLFDKVAYGLRKEDFNDLTLTDEERDDITINSGLRVVRWEAKDLELFPQKSTGAAARMKLRDLMLERRNKREQARKELLDLVDGLEDEEKRELIGLLKLEKGAGKKGAVDKKEKAKKESDQEGEGKEEKKRVKKPKEEVCAFHSAWVVWLSDPDNPALSDRRTESKAPGKGGETTQEAGSRGQDQQAKACWCQFHEQFLVQSTSACRHFIYIECAEG